eukprot:4946942-Amphidinium_carterae.1
MERTSNSRGLQGRVETPLPVGVSDSLTRFGGYLTVQSLLVASSILPRGLQFRKTMSTTEALQ